jgi:hypothetical protein
MPSELDRFTHELFTVSGAPHSHAWPIEPRKPRRLPKLPKPTGVVGGVVEGLKDAIVSLLQETLRDCLIAFGAVGTFLSHFGPAASLPLLLVLVLGVQAIVHRFS